MDCRTPKILVISTTPFELNGITNVILNYYRAMDKRGMKIDFVIPNEIEDSLREEFLSNGSTVYQLCCRNRKPWEYIRKLTKLVSQNKYNIVHAHGNSCTLALELYSAKMGGAGIRISHGHSSFCKHRVIHKLLRKVFDALYTQAFACGKKSGDWLYGGKQFYIINNGIAYEKYRFNDEIRSLYRERYNLNENIVIGHIGNFYNEKNHPFLIDIFAELVRKDKKYRLMLIGEGELRPNTQKKVQELGLDSQVMFMGSSDDIPNLLQAIDIIVMPSVYEGLPLSLIEAQAAGLTCFVSDAVSTEAAITDLLQFISLEESPKDWADQIGRTIPANREELSATAVKQITEAGYSIAENAKMLKELYKLLIAG